MTAKLEADNKVTYPYAQKAVYTQLKNNKKQPEKTEEIMAALYFEKRLQTKQLIR